MLLSNHPLSLLFKNMSSKTMLQSYSIFPSKFQKVSFDINPLLFKTLRPLIFFILLMPLLLCGCSGRTVVINNIAGREANEIVVLLQSRGIDAQKMEAPTSAVGGATAEQMWNISVPANQITEALSVLNQAGLPRVRGRTLLDLFGTQGLVPSDLQDRIRYQEGLSEQLANTIRKMDGIIDANVQISFPKEEDTDQVPTASVYVKHRGIMDNPNSLTVNKIKRLVASAVPGLKPDNVSVVSDRALYADIMLSAEGISFEERDFVSIWSIVVAKESAFRFRSIFYIFIIAIFLLACLLAWAIWKSYPVIRKKGGISSFFHPQPYEINEEEETKEEGEESESEE